MPRTSLRPILRPSKEGSEHMGKSRSDKIRSIQRQDFDGDQVFWMSLDEAKKAIADKYEFLADRYDRKYRAKAVLKHKTL